MAHSIVVDTSAYQSDSLSFFNGLKSHDVSGAIVKLTEGSRYTSPKAATHNLAYLCRFACLIRPSLNHEVEP